MIGIVFGCFIPMHAGHKKLIDRAMQECDEIIIAVCGYDDDRGKDFIPFKDRVKLVKNIYADNDRVKVVKLDDKKMGLTGTFSKEAWTIWGTELFKQAKLDPNNGQIYVWYTGEKSYITKLKQIYKKHHCFILVERDGVSGTKIRANLRQSTDLIDETFSKYLIDHKKLAYTHGPCYENSDLLSDIEDTLRDIYEDLKSRQKISWKTFMKNVKLEINDFLDSLKEDIDDEDD